MKSIRSLSILIVACAGLFAAPAAAAPADEAAKYVQTVGTQALAIISNSAFNHDQKQLKLEDMFARSIDFPWVGRFVLGRFWKQATDEQKTRYLAEYQRFLMNSYTSRFADYSGGSFKVTGSRADADDEFTVSTQMKAGDASEGQPILVDYRIHKVDSTFKIFDVVVEGVSLLTTQRTEFSSVLTNKGMDYLINQLAQKTANAAKKSAAKS